MCRCPSIFYCRRNPALEDPNPSKWRRKKKISVVCGSNGNTYKSRCYLRIAECTRGSKIKVKHRGACMKSSPERSVTPTSLPSRPNPYNGVAKTKPIKNIQTHPSTPIMSKKQRRKQRRQRKQKKKDKMARKKNRDNRQDNRDERKRNKNKGVKKDRKRSRKWRQRRRARQRTRRMLT